GLGSHRIEERATARQQGKPMLPPGEPAARLRLRPRTLTPDPSSAPRPTPAAWALTDTRASGAQAVPFAPMGRGLKARASGRSVRQVLDRGDAAEAVAELLQQGEAIGAQLRVLGVDHHPV